MELFLERSSAIIVSKPAKQALGLGFQTELFRPEPLWAFRVPGVEPHDDSKRLTRKSRDCTNDRYGAPCSLARVRFCDGHKAQSPKAETLYLSCFFCSWVGGLLNPEPCTVDLKPKPKTQSPNPEPSSASQAAAVTALHFPPSVV